VGTVLEKLPGLGEKKAKQLCEFMGKEFDENEYKGIGV
jgi:Holliday junction resolvasome RuvABC DNA-binding subunit